MPSKISAYLVGSVYGGLKRDASTPAASLLEGTFVGIHSGSGTILIADNRNSAGRVPAVGCLLQSALLLDPKGNTVETVQDFTFIRIGKLGNQVALKPGRPYYLSSGGGMTINKPTATGDLVQQVGVAESATRLLIHIGPAETI